MKALRRKAERGDAYAQFDLGFMYASGKGVKRDAVEAYKWWYLAAASAWSDADRHYADRRDAIATTMTPSQLAEAQKRASEWTAAYQTQKKK